MYTCRFRLDLSFSIDLVVVFLFVVVVFGNDCPNFVHLHQSLFSCLFVFLLLVRNKEQ